MKQQLFLDKSLNQFITNKVIFWRRTEDIFLMFFFSKDKSYETRDSRITEKLFFDTRLPFKTELEKKIQNNHKRNSFVHFYCSNIRIVDKCFDEIYTEIMKL